MKVATGEVQTAITQLKRREEFLRFRDQVVAESAPDQELHVILDNYCAHKKCDPWLARHPNVHFHFTPTSASWLNQVAIWFGILALMVVEIGLITPPVGMNVFIISSMAKDVPMKETFKGIVPFLISDCVRILLLVFVPSIALVALRF